MRLIALMGPAGSGKSTAAKYLETYYGARIYSFAQPLKELAMRTLDFTHDQCFGTQEQKETVDPRYGFSPRWFLQRLGTEGCRGTFGPNFWTDLTINKIMRDKPSLAVIDDCRFRDETGAVHRVGGSVWMLSCPDRQSAADGTHESEQGWKDCNYDRAIIAKMSPESHVLKEAVRQACFDTGINWRGGV